MGNDEVSKNVEGLPEHFHPVVEKYGRELFDFVMTTGLAGEAAGHLFAQAEKRASKTLKAQTSILVGQFSLMAQAVFNLREWTEEEIEEVNLEILRAATAIAPRVQLVH